MIARIKATGEIVTVYESDNPFTKEMYGYVETEWPGIVKRRFDVSELEIIDKDNP